jgi:hypothetical protein
MILKTIMIKWRFFFFLIRFHIWVELCFRLHIYCIGMDHEDLKEKKSNIKNKIK